jgi:hypothetical protein
MSTAAPPPGQPVPFKVVSQEGPRAQLDIVADTTIDGLRGLVYASGYYGALCLTYPESSCWSGVDFPHDSVAIALRMYQGCDSAALVGAYLSGSSLALDVVIGSNQCAPGAGMVAAPHYSLVSIAGKDLPAKLLRVSVDYGGSWSADSGLIDLRQPTAAPPAIDSRVTELRNAVTLAGKAAGGSVGAQLRELAASRFPTGPLTCSSAAGEVDGYLMAFTGVPGEYAYAAGQLLYCPGGMAI